MLKSVRSACTFLGVSTIGSSPSTPTIALAATEGCLFKSDRPAVQPSDAVDAEAMTDVRIDEGGLLAKVAHGLGDIRI